MTNNPSSNTFSSLDVEEFSLYDGREATRHFRRDHDLLTKARRDLFGSGDRRAVVLLQLGIDGNDCDEVVVDFYASEYGGEGAWASSRKRSEPWRSSVTSSRSCGPHRKCATPNVTPTSSASRPSG